MKTLAKQSKIVFIDWNGTLSHSRFWEQLSDPTHELHETHEKLENWLFKENYSLIDDWMLGKLTAEEICQRIGNGITEQHQQIFESLVTSCQSMKFCDPRVPTLVSNLRKSGKKIVIASDNMDVFRRFTIPALQLSKIFDGFILSNEMGFYKYKSSGGNLPFFDKYLNSQGLSYQNAVLLDDSEEKTGTFNRLGFSIIKITTPASFVSALKNLLIE